MPGLAAALPKLQFFSAAGAPLVNGTVTVYIAGSTTKSNTWQDAAQQTLNTNPIQLDARGEALVFLDPAIVYKFLLKNAGNVEQWTVEPISGAQPASSLAASSGASLIGFIQVGAGAVQREAQAKMRDAVSVSDFGAVGDGVTDDTEAIQAALSAHKVVAFPHAEYLLSSPITLQAGQVVHLTGATIKPSSALTTAAWTATGADDIHIFGGTFEGTGAAFSTGNENLMVLTSCANVRIYGTTFTKSRNEGLRLVGCSGSVVQGVRAANNYGVGLQDRDGVGNKWLACDGVDNGDTGVATSTGGRGLLTWRCIDTQVLGGRFVGNTEYGLRVYSQTGDSSSSSDIKVVGAHAEDNGKIDFYVYNEIGSLSTIQFTGCTVRRTTDPTGQAIALQGDNISWDGGSVTKVGTRMAVICVGFFDLTQSRIAGLQLRNVGRAISWSGSSLCSGVTVEGWIADCSDLGQLAGSDLTLRGNKLTHGGAGATDIGIDVGGATGVIIDGNEFDGFWRNVNWTAQALTLRNNTSRNTVDVSLRMNGDGVAGLVSSGNDWDTASNPIYVATAQRQGNPNGRITVYDTAAPAANTWALGDRVVNRNPAVGNPKSWVCTVAGTPGTWVSEGNL